MTTGSKFYFDLYTTRNWNLL